MCKTLSAKYYQQNKERLGKKAHERYQYLSNKEKQKKQQYGCDLYENLSEDEKEKLVEYRKKIIEREKIPNYNYKKHLF